MDNYGFGSGFGIGGMMGRRGRGMRGMGMRGERGRGKMIAGGLGRKHVGEACSP